MKKIFVVAIMLIGAHLVASEAKKLSYIDTVEDIIVSTQKIRDDTYNFQNGSEFAQFAIFEERSKQKKYFKKLDRQYRVVSKKIDAMFDKIRKQTKSLNKMAFQLEPVTSFNAYSTLVGKMLSDITLIQKEFFIKSDQTVKDLSKVAFGDILVLSESISKLRGLGSGAIARTYSEDFESDLLDEYLEDIEVNMSGVSKSMNSLNAKYNKYFPDQFKTKLTDLESSINKYIKFAEEKIIEQDKIDEDPNLYFDNGSIIIKKIRSIYEDNINALKEAI